MSNHNGPEYTAPDDVRCKALVKGIRSNHWEWTRYDHQCPRKANQMRGLHQVCYLHARARNVEYVT